MEVRIAPVCQPAPLARCGWHQLSCNALGQVQQHLAARARAWSHDLHSVDQSSQQHVAKFELWPLHRRHTLGPAPMARAAKASWTRGRARCATSAPSPRMRMCKSAAPMHHVTRHTASPPCRPVLALSRAWRCMIRERSISAVRSWWTTAPLHRGQAGSSVRAACPLCRRAAVIGSAQASCMQLWLEAAKCTQLCRSPIRSIWLSLMQVRYRALCCDGRAT